MKDPKFEKLDIRSKMGAPGSGLEVVPSSGAEFGREGFVGGPDPIQRIGPGHVRGAKIGAGKARHSPDPSLARPFSANVPLIELGAGHGRPP